LRQEVFDELRLEQRLHLLHRVAADGERRLHHEAGVAQHLLFGVALQQLVGDPRGHADPCGEDEDEDNVELEPQTHDFSLFSAEPPSPAAWATVPVTTHTTLWIQASQEFRASPI